MFPAEYVFLVFYLVTVIAIVVITFTISITFRDQELTNRKNSFAQNSLNIEKNLTLVLDELPDAVVIADPDRLVYMNN
jgi:hypothetical protein